MTNTASHTSTQRATRKHSADARDLLRAADLPEAIRVRIENIIRASRLWPRERAEIARELIAHGQDAIASGRSPAEATDALGDPATIGPLLRRSMRRKRPLAWQIRHRTCQALGIALLTMSLAYAVLFIRFNIGSPTIEHNYLAELNERNSRYTQEQKALPAFDALQRAWAVEYRPLLNAEKFDTQGEPLPTHAAESYPFVQEHARGYEDLVAAHTRVRSLLDDYIVASRLPTLGVLYSDRYEEVKLPDGSIEYKFLPPSEDPARSEPVLGVLLPWLAHARNNAKLIAFDAVLAARENNPARATESLIALFDTARLIGQEHTLIASLVSLAIQSMGETILLQILHEHPDLLDETHLTAIAHTATNSARIARDLDIETERRMFEDFLQRVYTDDGDGDGRLTLEGARFIESLASMYEWTDNPDDSEPSIVLRLIGPIASTIAGSRREQRELHRRIMNQLQRGLDAPPERIADLGPDSEYARFIASLKDSSRYALVEIVAPAIERSIAAVHQSQAHTNATLAAIALHIHHQRTGSWPDTLDQLTPSLLPRIPDDPFDPGQPIKYRIIDGTPHLYFVGANAIDNLATRPTTNRNNTRSLMHRYAMGDLSPSRAPEDQADWIVFPPQPSTE